MLDHENKTFKHSICHLQKSGQICIIPKPELMGFGGDSLTKSPLKVTSAKVVLVIFQPAMLVYQTLKSVCVY